MKKIDTASIFLTHNKSRDSNDSSQLPKQYRETSLNLIMLICQFHLNQMFFIVIFSIVPLRNISLIILMLNAGNPPMAFLLTGNFNWKNKICCWRLKRWCRFSECECQSPETYESQDWKVSTEFNSSLGLEELPVLTGELRRVLYIYYYHQDTLNLTSACYSCYCC